MTDIHPKLAAFQPTKDYFIGIDSDGCAFDTMELKHKECFIPQIIKHWGLQGVSKYAREAAEFVNLYSKWRGFNRWPALVKVFDLLEVHPAVQARGIAVPNVPRLRRWIQEESKLGLVALRALIEAEGGAELELALAWCEGVDAAIKDMVYGVAPFPSLEPCLKAFAEKADMLVVSQTPCEALEREWEEHGIDSYLHLICGQEMGTKTEHLRYATEGRYDKKKILMIGDAPGDRKAADDNGVLFYPILPGKEEESWALLLSEAMGKFFDGTYEGAYADHLIDTFEASLPEKAPWETTGCGCGCGCS